LTIHVAGFKTDIPTAFRTMVSKIWLWNTTTGKCLKTIHHDYPIKKIVPLSGGRFATADNDITIWDIATGNRLNTLPESRDANVLAPLDGNLLVSGHKKGSIKLWKL
jgi:WD40 repeat protein